MTTISEKIIHNPLRLNLQLPIDIKQWFNTEEELKDLGENNWKAFTYYKGMFAYVKENYKIYRWVEWEPENNVPGLLPNGFTYPTCYLSADGLSYAGKTYNFVDVTFSLGFLPTFVGLYDTPNSYQNARNKLVVVNNNETGLEFTNTIRIPINYSDDFSNSFTANSIVNKNYVDREIDNLKVQNGLTELSDKRTFELGGTLIKNTTINGNGFDFNINNARNITIQSSNDFNLTASNKNINLATGEISGFPNGLRYTNNPVFLNNSLVTRQEVEKEINRMFTEGFDAYNGLTYDWDNFPYTIQLGGELIKDTNINTKDKVFRISNNDNDFYLNNLTIRNGVLKTFYSQQNDIIQNSFSTYKGYRQVINNIFQRWYYYEPTTGGFSFSIIPDEYGVLVNGWIMNGMYSTSSITINMNNVISNFSQRINSSSNVVIGLLHGAIVTLNNLIPVYVRVRLTSNSNVTFDFFTQNGNIYNLGASVIVYVTGYLFFSDRIYYRLMILCRDTNFNIVIPNNIKLIRVYDNAQMPLTQQGFFLYSEYIYDVNNDYYIIINNKIVDAIKINNELAISTGTSIASGNILLQYIID